MELCNVVKIVLIIVLVWVLVSTSEHFAMHKRTRTPSEHFAMHKRSNSYYTSEQVNPGFGQQLGALETLYQGGFVSNECMNIAQRDNWDGPAFSNLVSCLQGDAQKPAINNLSV